MGGLIALQAAATLPGLLAVAAYEPVAFGCLDPRNAADAEALAWDQALAARLSAFVAQGDREAGVAAFVEAWNELPWHALPEKPRAELIAAAARLADEVRTISDDRTPASAYAHISAPLLLLHGDRSPEAAGLIVKRIRAAISTAHLRVVDGGHMAPIVKPETMAAIIGEFLDDAGC